MGSAFALWLSLAAMPLPLDWCLGFGDGGAPMELEACEFLEESTQMARLDAALSAVREVTGSTAVEDARTAFLVDRDLGCAIWAGFSATVPAGLTPAVCRMRRLFQRIEEVEDQLRASAPAR
jgi:hypothetical protein